MLYFKPNNRVYEGYAGDSSSFRVVRDGNITENNQTLSGDDYSKFNFDIDRATATIKRWDPTK